MQMKILSVFLGRIHSQNYYLKKLFLGLGMDYILIWSKPLVEVTALMFQFKSGICF